MFFGAVAIGRRVAAPIEAARRRQLEFTADASHELRTPLSVIEAHTSLALAQARDVAWYRTAFARVDHESKRMRRMLEDLLWLARFDASQPAARTRSPSTSRVLAAQAADRFGAIAETRHLTIDVTAPPDGAGDRGPAGVARPTARRPPRQRLQVRAGGRPRGRDASRSTARGSS